MTATTLEEIKNCIKSIPDYPIPGIMFRDITSLIENGAAFSATINLLVARYKDKNIAKVSTVGVGMRSHSGIASRMFQALARKKINIDMISTSEIIRHRRTREQLIRTGLATRLGQENIIPEDEQLGSALNQAIDEAQAFLAIDTSACRRWVTSPTPTSRPS